MACIGGLLDTMTGSVILTANEVKEVESHIDQLNAENAKLREERDMYRDLVGCMVHPDIPDQLHAENVKLRELVRDLWRFTGTACKKYPRLFDHAAQGTQTVQLNMLESFEQRIRELGVEVDG